MNRNLAVALLALNLGGICAADSNPETGRIEIVVREAGKAVPCRIHLYDAAGKTPKVTGGPTWNDHLVCDAGATLELPAGEYRYEVERGTEYSSVAGELIVAAGGTTKLAADVA